jgi:hypothetical protein
MRDFLLINYRLPSPDPLETHPHLPSGALLADAIGAECREAVVRGFLAVGGERVAVV